METLNNLILAGHKACHHLAVGQVRRCGVCEQDGEVAAIDMPPGYKGAYRPLCCRPICRACLATTKPLTRAEAATVNLEVTDFDSILKTAGTRRRAKVRL